LKRTLIRKSSQGEPEPLKYSSGGQVTAIAAALELRN